MFLNYTLNSWYSEDYLEISLELHDLSHTHSHTHHWHATEMTKMKYVVEVEVAHNYVLQ